MKNRRITTSFLKLVVYLIGIIVCGFYIVAVPDMVKQADAWYKACIIYTIIAVLLMTGIPFYLALFNTLKLLKLIDNNNAFSDLSVTALKNIKDSAISISGLYLLSTPLLYLWADKSDAPGILLIGLIVLFSSVVIATFTAVLERLLEEALAIKNDKSLRI